MRNASLKTKSTLSNDTGWKQYNWIQITRYVEKLQQRIYRAESLGNEEINNPRQDGEKVCLSCMS